LGAAHGARKGARISDVEPQRDDIIAKFSTGLIIFDANGAQGTTTLQSGMISLSTDDPYCVASPNKPCRYTINKIDLIANPVTVQGTPAENIRATSWYPAVGAFDDGTGMRLTVPPGMTFNVSGDVKKTPVVFTVRPTQPNVLSMVIDPSLQKITLAGSLSGSQGGWTLKLTILATSDAPFANVPPNANAGPDQVVSTGCFALVSLDKSKTSDPNNDLAFSYFTESGLSVGDGSAPVALLPGKHRLTLNAFDVHGARGRDDVVVDVKDDGTTSPVTGATLFAIETPPSVAIEDAGLISKTSLTFKPTSGFARVAASNVISFGRSSLEPVSNIQGDLWSAGDVELFPNTSVTGTIHTLGAISTKPGASTGGVDPNPTFAPPNVLSWNAFIPAQAGMPVSFTSGQIGSIDPGNYGDISLGPKAQLTLRSGIYTASSLSTKPGSIISIDDTNGPVLVYLRGSLLHQGDGCGCFTQAADDRVVG
jgi:hypothetical protein